MDESRHCILAVEDNPSLLACLQEVLRDEGYQVTGARTGQQALALAQDMPAPHLFLFDYDLGPRSVLTGLELYDRLHACSPFQQVPAILVSGTLPDEELLAQRALTGLPKPYDLDHLLQLVAQTCRSH